MFYTQSQIFDIARELAKIGQKSIENDKKSIKSVKNDKSMTKVDHYGRK